MGSSGTPPRILLADADAFYVAVARLVDPVGAGAAPLLIVGGSAQHRGVVTSASYEARRYGVHSAMPMARALRLCPDALAVPVPWEACVAKGREIKTVLERFTPAVEQASSDEFYLDLTGTERLYKEEPLALTARRIRDTVHQATSLTMSIGGGTSKLVAKLAASVAKPAPQPTSPSPRTGRGDRGEGRATGVGDQGSGTRENAEGVHIVEPGREGEFMRRFSLADIPGIGPKFQERLARLGLRSVDDALQHDEQTLAGWLGAREGEWLHRRVRGLDDGAVEPFGDPKSISRDDTFPQDLSDDAALAQKLLELVDRATSDLRESGLLARTVTVRLRDADFTTRQASKTVPEPIDSDRAVLAVARDLLARLRAARPMPARLLGVALSGFIRPDAIVQLSLLDSAEAGPRETDRDRTLARTIDQLRERFGKDAIARGRAPDA